MLAQSPVRAESPSRMGKGVYQLNSPKKVLDVCLTYRDSRLLGA